MTPWPPMRGWRGSPEGWRGIALLSGGRLGVSQSSASGRLQRAPDGRRAGAHREFGFGRAAVECRERYSPPNQPERPENRCAGYCTLFEAAVLRDSLSGAHDRTFTRRFSMRPSRVWSSATGWHARVATGAGAIRPTYGHVHQRHRVHPPGLEDRAVLHRTPTCPARTWPMC